MQDNITLELLQECILNKEKILERAIEYNNRSLFKMIDKDMQNGIKSSIMENLNKETIKDIITERFIIFIRGEGNGYE